MMRRRSTMAYVPLLVLAALAGLALAGCGAASTPTPTPSATPTPTPDHPLSVDEVLDLAEQAAAKVTSIRWVADVTMISRVEPEGWIRDDDQPKFSRMEMDRTLDTERAVFHLWNGSVAEGVLVDNRRFDHVDDEPWRETAWRGMEGMPERSSVLPPPFIAGVTLVGEEEIDGVGVYHVRGQRGRPGSEPLPETSPSIST